MLGEGLVQNTPLSKEPAVAGLLLMGSRAVSFTLWKVNDGHTPFPLLLQCSPVAAVHIAGTKCLAVS